MFFQTLMLLSSMIFLYAEHLPIVMPPRARLFSSLFKDESCLFYSEGINIIVFHSNKERAYATAQIRYNNSEYSWSDIQVKCSPTPTGTFKFTVKLELTKDVYGHVGTDGEPAFTLEKDSVIDFTIFVTGDKAGYWKLHNADVKPFNILTAGSFLDKSLTIQGHSKPRGLENVGMNSVHGRAWGCSSSQAFFFPVVGDDVQKPKYLIGISFYNTEIQPFGVRNHMFSLNMDDCVGTFSSGSWMSIIVTTVLFAAFIVGFLMLHSIRTPDRFDDPKRKPFLINAKD